MKNVSVVIKEPNIQSFKVTIKSSAPMIFNRWSEKAIQMIVDKQMKKASSNKRDVRNPEKDGEATFYKDKKGNICIPAIAIKSSMVSAVRNITGLTMSLIRGAVFVKGDEDGLIPLIYGGKSIRRDMVRIGMGIADVRFRGTVKSWKAKFEIKFNGDVLSAEQIVNLLQTAGFSCGLCEWRPEKGGDFGTFEVVV